MILNQINQAFKNELKLWIFLKKRFKIMIFNQWLKSFQCMLITYIIVPRQTAGQYKVCSGCKL